MCKISVVQPLLSPSLPDNKIISSISDEFSLGFFVNCCCYFRFTLYKSIFLIHTTFSDHITKSIPRYVPTLPVQIWWITLFILQKGQCFPSQAMKKRGTWNLMLVIGLETLKGVVGNLFFSPPLQKSKEHDLFSVLQKIRIEVS